MSKKSPEICLFGAGYVACRLAPVLIKNGWQVFATTRDKTTFDDLREAGITPVLFGDDLPSALNAALVTHPPHEGGDDTFLTYVHQLEEMDLDWFGYLSTTGVYGDAGGDWVDETSPLNATGGRARNRITAENQWQSTSLPWHIFRLSGIYGPGRNLVERLKEGKIDKMPADDGPVNRIHVDDIVQILARSLNHPTAHEIFNVADDDPCSTQATLLAAAEKLGLTNEVNALPAAAPTPRGFMGEGHRKVSNQKVKTTLNITLIYPSLEHWLKRQS